MSPFPAILRVTEATLLERHVGSTGGGVPAWFLATLSAAILAFCSGVYLQGPIVFPLDDAYITLHNARALISGIDSNFPGVSPLTGATSLVHLGIIAILIHIAEPETAAFIVGGAAILVYAIGLARLAFQHKVTPPVAAAVVLLGLLTGYAPYHLFNGLETGAMMAAITWALVLAEEPRLTWPLPLLCGLMPFVRPELAALSGLLMARQSWLRLASGDAIRLKITGILADWWLLALAAAPWTVWFAVQIGTPFPSTAAAKVAFFAEADYPASIKAAVVVIGIASGIGPLLAGIALLRGASLSICAWLFLAFVAGAFFLTFPGGLHHNAHRYAYLFLPIALYACLHAMKDRGDRVGKILLASGLLWCTITLPNAWREYSRGRQRTDDTQAAVQWAKANLPLDSRLLIHDVGYFAFASDFTLIDAVGLKTPEAVKYHQRWTAPSNGHLRHAAIHEIAERYRPSHAVILNDEEGFWVSIADDLRAHGWVLETLREPPGSYGMVVYRLTLDE